MKSRGALLQAYLNQVGRFNWQESNCCQFALDWMRFINSPDAIPGFRRVTYREIVTKLRELGGLEGLCSEFLNQKPVAVTQLKIGDLVLVPAGGRRKALGILAGRTAAALTYHGVVHLNVSSESVGWNIR